MDTKHLNHRKFFLKDGYSFSSIVVRETCGLDEIYAAQRARGSNAADIAQEMVRRSVVCVDEDIVIQPYAALDKWSSKERAFLVRAYQDLNEVEDEEFVDFSLTSQEISPEELVKKTGK